MPLAQVSELGDLSRRPLLGRRRPCVVGACFATTADASYSRAREDVKPTKRAAEPA